MVITEKFRVLFLMGKPLEVYPIDIPFGFPFANMARCLIVKCQSSTVAIAMVYTVQYIQPIASTCLI